MTTRLIEKRKPTAEPLVEIGIRDDGKDGPFVPAGRRFASSPRTDGLNIYGLTPIETLAFEMAEDRLEGRASSYETDPELSAALVAAGLGAGADDAKRAAFAADWYAQHPLPTSFAPLAFGDPSNNLEEVPENLDDGEWHSVIEHASSPDGVTWTLQTPATSAATSVATETAQPSTAPSVASDTKAAEITHVEQLTPAVQVITGPTLVGDAPPETTHLQIPVTHVHFLHRLLNDVEKGVGGAEQALATAVRRIFHRSTA